jgi:hypothetical protein
MTDAEQIVENLINTEGIHAFVFVCEAADKYLPSIESVAVQLENGQMVKVTDMDRTVGHKLDETRKILKREDRIVWALRFYKKALIEQLLWMVQNQPQYFKRKFKSPPTAEQPVLMRQLQKLGNVDITPFQEFDPEDLEAGESPYSGFTTLDAINERIGRYLNIVDAQTAEDAKAAGPAQEPEQQVRYKIQDVNQLLAARAIDPEKALKLKGRQRRMIPKLISGLIFEPDLSYGEVISLFRRAELALRQERFPGGIQMYPTPEGPYDLKDKEGPVETLIEFPDGWRWFDLHRNCSKMRDDPLADPDIAITGHCANFASKLGIDALELAEPLGNNRWKHQAFFVMHKEGIMGEMKGRKNQKPSPRLEKYIFELLRRDKRIQGFGGQVSWNSAHDFALSDLTKPHLATLMKERPELFKTVPPQPED